jgi:hypothetical protein
MYDDKPSRTRHPPVAGHSSADDIWLAAPGRFIGS